MNVLVLGAAGLLGNAVFRVMSERSAYEVCGTIRSPAAREHFTPDLAAKLHVVEDLTRYSALEAAFAEWSPDVVVNCIAPPKESLKELDKALSVLAVFPRQLAHLCRLRRARLVHLSSDGVFSGARGAYTEDDCPDPTDVYGVAKYLGEPAGDHTVTVRTSMLGHELGTRHALLEWFLAQQGSCRGFTRAVFSGLPTVELARIIRDVIVPNLELAGVYHVAAAPISKFALLELVAAEYGKAIALTADDSVALDRSLVAEKFRAATGYTAPPWPELLRVMRSYRFGLTRH
jgi:dTDP-4-dehydrorhamnose reductase